MLLHALLLSLVQSPAPIALPPQAEPKTDVAHGGVAWFRRSFEEALAEAAKRKTSVFVDFWTTWCGWCKKLEQDTFTNEAVRAELAGFVCVSIDAESKEGAPIAQRYSATSFPTLVFVEPDGSLRERVLGYLPPGRFLAEARRIADGDGTMTELAERVRREPKNPYARGEYLQRLMQLNDGAGVQREGTALRDAILAGEGWTPESAYERWRVAQLQRQIGDAGGADTMIAAIGGFGERGVAFLQRRAVLDAAIGAVNRGWQTSQRIDVAPLRVFCGEEKDTELVWDARVQQKGFESFRASREEQAGEVEKAKASRKAARASAREAWTVCPERFRSDFGRELVALYLRDAEELAPDELSLASDVARAVVERAPDDPARYEMLARALYAQGHVDRATTALQKALELAPERASARRRLERWRAAPKKG